MEVVELQILLLQVDVDIDLVQIKFYQFNFQENRCGREGVGMTCSAVHSNVCNSQIREYSRFLSCFSKPLVSNVKIQHHKSSNKNPEASARCFNLLPRSLVRVVHQMIHSLLLGHLGDGARLISN